MSQLIIKHIYKKIIEPQTSAGMGKKKHDTYLKTWHSKITKENTKHAHKHNPKEKLNCFIMAYGSQKHSKDIGQIMFKLFIETRKMFTIEKIE